MLKKLIILCASLAFGAGLFAQSGDATIAASDVKYWIGSGNNEVVFAVNFGSPDTCLAWGFRFSADSIIVKDMMDSIATYDTRFSYSGASSTLSNITFSPTNNITFTSLSNFWMYNVNGSLADWGYDQQWVKDGDFVKWGDADVATYSETTGWPSVYEWSQTVTAVYVPDATIASTDIKYWVGTGSHEVVMAVNWANPDTCLAWGYRFSADSITVSDMMTDIANADNRFSYDSASGWLLDIKYINGTDTLKISSGSYWMYNVNGMAAQNLFTSQYVKDGDFVKFGDVSVAIVNDTDSWGYPSEMAWTKTVTPVTNPSQQGIVAADGSINFSVYPNPASSKINVTVENGEATQIILMDASGRTIKTVAAEDAVNHTIDVSALSAGVYFVNVRNENVSKVSKLIIR